MTNRLTWPVLLALFFLAAATVMYQWHYRTMNAWYNGKNLLNLDACEYYGFWHWANGNPWQYRVLAPFLDRLACEVVRPKIKAYDYTKGRDFMPWSHFVPVFWRLVENFFLLALLYRAAGTFPWLKVTAAAWFLCLAAYNSNFAGSSYLEGVIFFLATTFRGTKGKPLVALGFSILGALNRETGAFLCLFYLLTDGWRLGALSAAAFVAVQAALRFVVFPGQPMTLDASMSFMYPGKAVFLYNLGNPQAIVGLVAVMAPLAILATSQGFGKKEHRPFLVVGLAYAALILFTGSLDEYRLLLVPLLWAFLPRSTLNGKGLK